MENINTLLYSGSTTYQCKIAANNIITTYELYFSIEDIIKAFEYIRNSVIPHYLDFKRIHTLMYLTLTTNLKMFIAIIYSLLDDKVTLLNYYFLVRYKSSTIVLGNSSIPSTYSVAMTYCALQDYHSFDISNLELTNECRNIIQNHINGKHIKAAVKNKKFL